jgi:hypothetical protein
MPFTSSSLAPSGRRRPGSVAHHEDLSRCGQLSLPTRNALVFSRRIPLPRVRDRAAGGYQLLECTCPSQVLTDLTVRLRISFMNRLRRDECAA